MDKGPVVGADRGTDIHPADLVGADDQPVAATGEKFAAQLRPVDDTAPRDEGHPGAKGSGDGQRRLEIDMHVEEVLRRQRADE